MITAKEARQLVENCEASITRRLDEIGQKIIEAANLGKTELWLASALPNNKEFEVAEIPYRNPEFTPIQRMIETELKKLGYTMKIVPREFKIGCGLGIIGEETGIETRPYILITW